ncbi:hypothetical protein NDU88_007810 [Pleurodeles waltl]|uniref:Uncharacterized protein n=1 Tax=Pleurodeles waltl TaxID=8319 RepID=A0AAV7RV51_PLEWA|nr:hypothetical protein NDU88_007810 [Pleurodeles waltl]
MGTPTDARGDDFQVPSQKGKRDSGKGRKEFPRGTPPREEKETPPQEEKETPPREEKETPPREEKETPPREEKETPQEQKETPQEEKEKPNEAQEDREGRAEGERRDPETSTCRHDPGGSWLNKGYDIDGQSYNLDYVLCTKVFRL